MNNWVGDPGAARSAPSCFISRFQREEIGAEPLAVRARHSKRYPLATASGSVPEPPYGWATGPL